MTFHRYLSRSNLGQVAKTVDRQLGSMGGQRITPCGLGDEDTGKMAEQFEAWSSSLLKGLQACGSSGQQPPSAQADAGDAELSDG